MSSLKDPIFITSDPNQIVSDLIAFYETETGLSVSPAQAERLLINVLAYRESLLRSGINEAAKQNLVAFATGVILDYLAQLVGVRRLDEQPADTTVQFQLVTGHGNVVIPKGTRVASQDGAVVFYTLSATSVASGVDEVDVLCRCETPGVIGNGYIAGTVNIILDPQAYLSSAENISTTTGGVDVETDEQLRLRIYMAPEQYSTAGSTGAYRFFAMSANQAIIDAEVVSSAPGVVDVYPLTLDSGGTPSEILNEVAAILSDEKVRPLNDLVNVISPAAQDYTINVQLELFDTADQVETLQLAQAAGQTFVDVRRSKLGRDVIIDQLKAVLVIPGAVYKANVIAPVADIVLDKTKYANCTSISITVSGLNNG
jgi:phage-related baseplate assembly protein